MDNINVKFNKQGLEELIKKTQTKFTKIAEDVRDEAKDLAPVDTGKLRDSIDVFYPSDKNVRYVGSTVPYAIYQELGTIRNKPTAFLRIALEKVIRGLK